jgi:flavin reductase (DIM6/NTAB) family NADH-FMN oxidoreductase RutF
MAATDYEVIEGGQASLWVPAPVILVAAAAGGERNVMIAVRLMRWDDPPNSSIMVGVAKHSVTGELLRASGEFTVGILADGQQRLLAAAKEVSRVSSREVDKFAAYGLDPLPATRVQAPLVDGCAINVECKLRRYVDVQDHYDAVIGDVLALHVRRELAPVLLVASQPWVLPVKLEQHDGT